MTTNPFNPITVDWAIEECTDLEKLRHLARLYRKVMISEHEQGAHLLDIADCGPCMRAVEESEPSYACDDFRRRQKAYTDALRADSILSEVTR